MKSGLKTWLMGLGIAALSAVVVFSGAGVPQKTVDLKTLSNLPVLHSGRVKPLDTVARSSLMMISGKQTLRAPGGASMSAIEWLLDVMYAPERAERYEVFRIDDPDVLGLLGLEQDSKVRFSYNLLSPKIPLIQQQASRAGRGEDASRFGRAVMALANKLILYQRLQNSAQPGGMQNVGRSLELYEQGLALVKKGGRGEEDFEKTFAPLSVSYRQAEEMAEFLPLLAVSAPGNAKWIGVGESFADGKGKGAFDAGFKVWTEIGDGYRESPERFNAAVARYAGSVRSGDPEQFSRSGSEALFNRIEPFYKSMILYILSLLATLVLWLTKKEWVYSWAYGLLGAGFIVHTAGLVSRMVLQGRPPVTNLYSSAVFVGWGAVLFGIIAERMYRRSVAGVVAALVGFITLIIAHHLALQGDTMEMMRAVLDSNFWLATHVVTITIGYSATFMAGVAATVYLVRRAFRLAWGPDSARELSRVVYGLLCLSLFFCFIGTVLGGIWADQSWGRFWGWDPKENGALLIVLWMVFILHARIGRVASDTAVMMMSVFGNIVTAFAWFGVNMLNIGLHSYGAMDKAFSWLVIFVISQLAIMALGFVPEKAAGPKPDGKQVLQEQT